MKNLKDIRQTEAAISEAKKWKVTFVHKHPEGEKKYDYTVDAPHQNAADKKAISMHRQAHPQGDFHMWGSDRVSEGLEDACWKGYEAIGTKMKGGKEVPNCVPKEGATEDAAGHRQAAHAALKKGDIDTYHSELDKKHAIQSAEAEKAKKLPVKTYEDTTTIEKPVVEDKNLQITKHAKMAIEAGKRGDKYSQQWHLEKIKRLKAGFGGESDGNKNESVVSEAAKKSESQKHLVTVTVTDPQHSTTSKRKEKVMKRVKVSAADPKEAVKKAEAHYKKHGFKVHDSLHHSIVSESLDTDEFIDSYDPEQDIREDDAAEESASMARAQLREIADMAQDLVDAMEDGDELEPWMQYKVTSANKDLDDVYSSIAYGDDDKDEAPEADAGTEYPKEAFEPEAGEEDQAGLSDQEKGQIAKIKTLIRLGLLDNSEMQVTLRAIKKLDMDQPVTSSSERQAINLLVQKLIGVVTGDDMVFRKIRLNVQK